LSAKEWIEYLLDAFANRNYNSVNSLLLLIDLDRITLLFKDRKVQFGEIIGYKEDSLWVDLLKSGQPKFIESLVLNT
jgi:hypothetical protein